jgi:pimeloyl-ACP methyl ester carboxylesterase
LAFRARRLYAQGFDVVLVNLPFHARRAPPGRVRPMFPSTDPVRANEGFAQAVMDVRALVATLLARGAPAVGVTGMSLGGYTSALLATVEARLAFVVPIIPFSSLPRLMWEHGEGTAARARAEAVGITLDHFAPAFAATDPLARAPVVDPPRILIIAGERDRVTPSHHARRLHEHFAGSRFLTFPGSHLVHAGLDEVFAEVVAFAQGIGQ